MDWRVWIGFVTASALIGLAPGPGVMSIVGYALSSGRRVALASVAGIALGNGIAMTLSLAGVGALLAASALAFLPRLEAIIDERAASQNASSYTARLLAEGPSRIAQKVGEEGVEVALAAMGTSNDEVRSESADLVFHLLVLLHSRGIPLADVARELESRHPPGPSSGR